MKPAFSIAIATLFAAATLSADTIFDQLSPKDFKSAGLDKLSDKELARLESLLDELQPVAETAVAPAAPAPEAKPSSSAADFGREQIAVDTSKTPKKIESRLIGTFDGWYGGTLFELENGQIWQQRIDERQKYTPKENPKVTVYKSFGGYRIRFEGYNQSCPVKRVK